jgi:PAS domain-containing protein
MDASEALAATLVERTTELIPDAECVLAIVPREERECLKVVAGAGSWAVRQIGTEWPRTGTLAGRSLRDGRALESPRLWELGEPNPDQTEGRGMHSIIAVDRNNQVIVWNPGAERLLGIMTDEALGQPLPELGIPIGKLLLGRERRATLRRRGGGEFPTTVTTTALPGPDEGTVLLVKDMTPWIGPASRNMTGTGTLLDLADPARDYVNDDEVVRLDWTASHNVETRILGFLAWLLPARERVRFVVEATANLEFCDSAFQRIDFLLATAIGTPRLAFMLRRANRRRSGD